MSNTMTGQRVSRRIALGLLATMLIASSARADLHAILVGVSDYASEGVPDLRFAAKDAMDLYDTLRDRNGVNEAHMRLFVRDQPDPTQWPTRGALREAIPEFLSTLGPDDTVVFFFSGHGIRGQATKKAYLLPFDFELHSLTKGLDEVAIDLEWLNHELQACKAGQKVCLIDACHSGGLRLHEADIRGAFDGDSVFIIMSCGRDQQSFEWPEKQNGIFTYWLRRGLEGAAIDDQTDGMISFNDLFAFVHERVAATAEMLSARSKSGEFSADVPIKQNPVFVGAGGITSLPLVPEDEFEDAFLRFSEVIDDMLRQAELKDSTRIGVLDFAQRNPMSQTTELRGNAGTFGALAAERMADNLQQLANRSYAIHNRRQLAQVLPKGFGPDDVANAKGLTKLRDHAGSEAPDYLLVGEFRRFTEAEDRLVLSCDLIEAETGKKLWRVSTLLMVSPELWQMLGGPVEVAQATVEKGGRPVPEPPKPGPQMADHDIAAEIVHRLNAHQKESGQHPLISPDGATYLDVEVWVRHPGDEQFHRTSLQPVPGGGPGEIGFPVSPGDVFRLRVRNRTPENLAALILVDGLDTFGANAVDVRETPLIPVSEARPWLFPGGSTQPLDVRGWYKQTAAAGDQQQFDYYEFLIDELPDEDLRRAGYTDQLGQILVSVYGTRERIRGVPTRGLFVSQGERGSQTFGTLDFMIDRNDFRASYPIRYFPAAGAPAPQTN